jgi:hypothetical protein
LPSNRSARHNGSASLFQYPLSNSLDFSWQQNNKG